MAADSHRQIAGLRHLDCFMDAIDRAVPHQRVPRHTPHVESHRAGIHLLLDVILQGRVGLAGRDFDVWDKLHVPPELAIVAVHILSAGFEDGVDAMLLGQAQRLHELLVSDVGTEERASVLQISRVHIARDEVSAQ